MKLHRILATACLTVVLPAVAAAQNTTYDFDKSAPFSQYRTYAFQSGTSSGNELVDKRIQAALETQLRLKGLTKVDVAPDVFVVYHMAYDKQKDISTYSVGPIYGGFGWGWGGGWGSTTTDVRVREILVGTLAIDIIDASRKQVAWRGLGTKEVDTDAKPEELDEKIAKAVAKIMKNYPPRADS